MFLRSTLKVSFTQFECLVKHISTVEMISQKVK